ncbi:MAG: aspartate--tRNA ligase [Oscillospiraceae bacterium]|nr:aspartate--tRNA ligase [Oscillospiraceae bacterium]
MNTYRTDKCGELTKADISRQVKLAGWVDTIRDHGGLVFLDLRDHFGIVQIVFEDPLLVKGISRESVISVEGTVGQRSDDVVNPNIATGEIEVRATSVTVLSRVLSPLPFDIGESTKTREDIRLKYRFLDLRNPDVHKNILLRTEVIDYIRAKMKSLDFTEIQTPILTVSSPEGARDYIVPSRKHPGMFYALPQAPQQFKQLLMVAGFDRYFQIAPCFRDEDARSDRLTGDFYQLDFEMSFATQEDVFAVAEEVMYGCFTDFTDKEVTKPPFPRITYADSMLKYGSDKPDLRNPLIIVDLSKYFTDVDFMPFKNKAVRGIVAPNTAEMPRSFFDGMLNFATLIGMKGLGYIQVGSDFELKGPIAKFLSEEKQKQLIDMVNLAIGDTIFFISDILQLTDKLAGQIRTELGVRLNLIDDSKYEMCFITDFPMYGLDETTGKTEFLHNPFSMPQGGLEALETISPLDIKAYQYDFVCNGYELSSGAVRNHRPDIMIKAFELAGYTKEDIDTKFPALFNAFHYGAPPHAGMAPGIDRIIMLISEQENLREVIAFPMNSNAQDLMMGAPGKVNEQQLRETHIRLR